MVPFPGYVGGKIDMLMMRFFRDSQLISIYVFRDFCGNAFLAKTFSNFLSQSGAIAWLGLARIVRGQNPQFEK